MEAVYGGKRCGSSLTKRWRSSKELLVEIEYDYTVESRRRVMETHSQKASDYTVARIRKFRSLRMSTIERLKFAAPSTLVKNQAVLACVSHCEHQAQNGIIGRAGECAPFAQRACDL